MPLTSMPTPPADSSIRRIIAQKARTGLLRKSESVMYYHTVMASAKVAITIPSAVLKRVDALVKRRVFPNRSKAIQHALHETLERMDRGRLARECAKLDPREEQAMAEEGISLEIDQWPEY